MSNYTARPFHLVFPVLLFALGAWAFLRPGWELFGLLSWIVGALAVFWIVVSGIWSDRARYNDSLADLLEASSKVDLDKMAALGLKCDDVKESVNVSLFEGSRSRHFDLPASSVKLRSLALGLLNGQPFSEKRWVIDGRLFSASEFRSLRLAMRSRGLIEPVNDKDNRQGFSLTDAGRELLKSLVSSPSPAGEIA